MKCILSTCKNIAKNEKLHFVTLKQHNEGFRFCQEHWDNTFNHNLEKLVNIIQKKIDKFAHDWNIGYSEIIELRKKIMKKEV